MTDWWDHLELDPSDDLDRRKAERLARVLRRLPGDEETKVRWCLHELPLLEAEADREGAAVGRQQSGAIVSLAIRYYRRWWSSPGRERPQQADRRDNAPAFGTREQKATVPPRLRAVPGGEDS